MTSATPKKKPGPGLFWRGNKIWAQKRVKGRPAPLQESMDTDNIRVAKERQIKWLAQITTTKWDRKGAHLKWEQACELFEVHLARLSEGGAERYRDSLKHLSIELADKLMIDIDRSDLARFRARREKDRGCGGLISPASIRRDLACLSSMFTFLETEGHLADVINPVPSYLKANKKTLPAGDPKTRYLSEEEEASFLRVLRRLSMDRPKEVNRHAFRMLELAVVIALDSGMRLDEIRLANRRVNLRLHVPEWFVQADVAKNGKARVVPILDRTLRYLRKTPAPPTGSAVVWHGKGEHYSSWRTSFMYAVDVWRKETGGEPFTFHDLRRTFGCRAIQVYKMPLKEVSAWLGHSSVAVTERHYAFLGADTLREAAARINAAAARLPVAGASTSDDELVTLTKADYNRLIQGQMGMQNVCTSTALTNEGDAAENTKDVEITD